MAEKDLLVCEIQRFSIHDGPGLRTTVFLKGCNLRCAWCHNPETQAAVPQLQYFEEKCLHCGSCFSACHKGALSIRQGRIIRNAALCAACGSCAAACPSNALHFVGRSLHVDQLLDVLQKDRAVFPDFSGVTFSGGEPMLQVHALQEILPVLKAAGYHIAIDTAGDVPWSAFQQILPSADLFLFDIKLMDSALHKAYTGVGNERIITNLMELSRQSQRIWVRLPLVSGINDTQENIHSLCAFLDRLPQDIERIDLLAYHSYGRGKAKSLQMEQPCFAPPSAERLQEIKTELKPYASQIY